MFSNTCNRKKEDVMKDVENKVVNTKSLLILNEHQRRGTQSVLISTRS